MCDYGDAQTSNSVQRKEMEMDQMEPPLPIQQMELPGVH